MTTRKLITIAISFTLIMFVGLFASLMIKNQYIIHSNNGTNSGFDTSIDLRGNHSYLVQVTISSDADYEALVEGTMQVYLDGELIESSTFHAIDHASSNRYNAHASDTEGIWLFPESDTHLRVVVEIEEGDEWTYLLYEDAPQNLGQIAFLFGLLGTFGMVPSLALIYLHMTLEDNENQSVDDGQYSDY